jgi:hydroxymethylpyrimidine pyrophosphatase-like HAD family hydrolase
VDILEFYGLFLSRDWSKHLHGYFSTDWSHLWLPENGQPNKIKINRERYLKHIVTYLNDPNEPFVTSVNSFEIRGMNTFFGNFMIEISSITNPRQQSEIMTYTQTSALPSVSKTVDEAQIWSFYFDGSKYKEAVGAGCVLIDPVGIQTFISYRLEFECTNNTSEYEALLQGLRKYLDMDVQNLMVFGDS